MLSHFKHTLPMWALCVQASQSMLVEIKLMRVPHILPYTGTQKVMVWYNATLLPPQWKFKSLFHHLHRQFGRVE